MEFTYQLVWHDGKKYREIKETDEQTFLKKAEAEGFKALGRSGTNPAHRECLHNQPKISDCHGPCYNGVENGLPIIRYEGPGA